jgi:uncharacterized protein (DUF1810 family)
MIFDLDRFISARAGVYEVCSTSSQGRKTGHWIWFIFPQVAGLGSSSMSQHYAIGSLDEARAYLAHPVLGTRLRECAGIVLETQGRTASDIFGSLDAMKVRSSMTLFQRAAPDEPVFGKVLARFYGGVADDATTALRRTAASSYPRWSGPSFSIDGRRSWTPAPPAGSVRPRRSARPALESAWRDDARRSWTPWSGRSARRAVRRSPSSST